MTQAIATVEASRQTHVEWRDYWMALEGHDCGDPACASERAEQANIAGNLAHHVAYIEGYGQVLGVLRAALGTSS